MRVKFDYSQESKDFALHKLQERFSQEQHRKVHDRLVDLSEGCAPESEICGICNDVDEMCGVNGYEYMSHVFVLMGLDSSHPLDDHESTGTYWGKWEGPNGEERRELAKDAASVIRQLFLE